MATFQTAVVYDTLANRPSDNASGTTGRLFIASDLLGLIYRDNGTSWDAITARNKYDATAAPGVNDDSGDGYSIGSMWIDTTADNIYICTDATLGAANWEHLNGGGGSGNVTTANAYASLSAGASGDLAFPTDGYSLYRSNGAALVPWGPLYPLVAPVDGDFSWVNQDSAAVSTTKGGIHLSRAASATASLKMRVKTAPAVPYVITACIVPAAVLNVATHNYGLVFRQSSDGKCHVLTLQHASNVLGAYSVKWTNATTYSADYTNVSLGGWGCPLFLRIADDNTNRILSISRDGQNFVAIHTVGRTDFLTADQVGFYVSPQNASFGIGITLLSWRES